MNLDLASDRLNPIVVKEVRQGLRARAFVVWFSLLLAGCVLVALGAWSRDTGGDAGRDVFVAILGCLAVASLVVVPFGAFRSLSGELVDDAWPMLLLTGLSARQVLRGKMASALVQSLLYASAAAPFLLFSYFLPGVAMASVLAALLLTLGLGVLATIFATAAATFATGKRARGLATMLVLVALAWAVGIDIAAAGHLVDDPETIFTKDTLTFAAAALVFTGSFAAIVFEVAAGRLAPSSANTAKGPRIALLVHLATPALFLFLLPAADRENAGFAFFVWGTALLYVLGAYGLGEGAAPPRAVREKNPIFGLLIPGSWRAFRFALVVEIAFAALFSLSVNGNDHADAFAVYASGPLFLAFYLGLAALLARALPSAFDTPLVQRGLAFALVGAGTAGPLLLALLAGGSVDDPSLNLLNPALAFAQGLSGPTDPDSVLHTNGLLRGGLAIAIAFIADRMLASRERLATR